MKHEGDPEDEESESAGITYSGGDGSAPSEAIVIEGASSHAEGIRAEKRYIARRFGEEGADWRLQSQSLLVEDSRVVDELTVEDASGKPRPFTSRYLNYFGQVTELLSGVGWRPEHLGMDFPDSRHNFLLVRSSRKPAPSTIFISG